MKSKYVSSLAMGVMLLTGSLLAKGLEIGKPAPDFSLPGADGEEYRLQDYRGKYVVLEWTNYDCPFVGKHYRSGNVQALQQKYTAKDVIWLSICSSAPGKQGNFSKEVILKRAGEMKTAFTAYLMDVQGQVGRLYGAKTTPHMFVIDPEGRLIYMGGIDNIRSTDVEDIAGATNFVSAALDARMAGNAVLTPVSKPYGCSVKY